MPDNASASRAPTFTPETIRRLVDRFYTVVQDDPELGPIFARVVGGSPGGWPPHLDKMTAFWCAVLLHQPGFKGDPRAAHAGVHDIEPAHFRRWLDLFRVQAREVFEEAPATFVIQRAEMMGQHLQRALFT